MFRMHYPLWCVQKSVDGTNFCSRLWKGMQAAVQSNSMNVSSETESLLAACFLTVSLEQSLASRGSARPTQRRRCVEVLQSFAVLRRQGVELDPVISVHLEI